MEKKARHLIKVVWPKPSKRRREKDKFWKLKFLELVVYNTACKLILNERLIPIIQELFPNSP